MLNDPRRSFVYNAVPTNARFGVGEVRHLGQELDRLESQRVLFVTTPGGKRRHEDIVLHDNRFVAVFDRVEPHCPEPTVQAVVSSFLDAGADTVVTLGGGSAIGLGKVLAAEHGAKFIAIPTTYSGSEVTPIYGRKIDGEKRTRVDRAAIPHAVIYDPELTLTLPAAETSSTGMNSLAHAVEALYPPAPNPIARQLAFEAVELLVRSLPICVEEPDNLGARSDALYAGFIGGLLVSMVGVALHHALGHILGGLFNMRHGDYNSAVLPQIVGFNQSAVPDIGRAFERVGIRNPGEGVHRLVEQIGAPSNLRDLGMPEDGIELAARAALKKSPRNPRQYTAEDMLKLIGEAYYGRPPNFSPMT